MYKNLLTSLCLIICPVALFAQDDNPFPDLIVPKELKFTFLSKEAADTILRGKIIDSVRNEESNEFAYLYNAGDNLSVAVRCFNGWLIPEKALDLINNGQGGGIRLINLDDSGNNEILIWSNYTFSHNSNDGGNNESYNNYILLNPYKQQLVCSGTFAYDEMIWSYNGPGINDKDDDVTRNKKYLSYNYFSFNYDIKATPGKLVFDNIYYYANAPQYPDEERYRIYRLDTVSEMIYKMVDGKLVKQSIVPKSGNTAPDDGYKMLKGKIDKYAVTMQLVKFDREYEGYYYYNNKRVKIPLHGRHTTDNATPLVLEESLKNRAIFRGALNNGVFSGKWIDGQKMFDFNLHEVHDSNSAQLIPYRFDDCYITDDSNNSFCASIKFFLPNDAGLNERKWEALNRALKQVSNVYCESNINLPEAMHNIFRRRTIGQVTDDMFRSEDEGEGEGNNSKNVDYYYTNIEEEVLYNDNGILCISTFQDEYTGGAHPNHNFLYLLYDLHSAKEISINDIFTCTDSVLFALIKAQVTADNASDTYRLSYLMQTSNNTLGVFYIVPGYCVFYYSESEITALLPFDKLKNYMKPSYRKRLTGI